MPPVRAVAPLLVLCALAFAGEVSSEPRPSAWLLALDAAVAIGACVSLPWWWSRLRPTALVLVAVTAALPTVTPVAATAVFLLARHDRLRPAVLAGAGGALALVVRGTWQPLSGVGLGWWTAVAIAGYAAVVGWGAWVQAHEQLVRTLEERARRAEQDQAERVAEGRRAERARIAREMHDSLAHRLAVLSTLAGALEYNPQAPPEHLARAADAIRSSAHASLDDLRSVIGVLRDDPEPGHDGDSTDALERPQPTLRDVPGLVEEWRRAGASVVLRDALDDEATDHVPAALGRTVYRVAQEALTNAAKHAPGEPVRVELRGRPGDRLELAVTNSLAGDGTRNRPNGVPGSGYGLVGLAERVSLAGGSLEVTATSSEHRLVASLPWPA